MSFTHITSQSLRHLLTLTEKKEQFLKGLEEVENEIGKALKGASASVVEAAEAISPFKPAKKAKGKKARKTKAGKQGGLKAQILAVLHDAGDQGLKVKEIADKLGAKAGNISVWFSTTGKKLTTKVEPGRYAVKGAKPVVVEEASVATPAKAAPVKKAGKRAKKSADKPAVAALVVKPVKAAKKAKPVKKKSGLTPEGRAKLAANMKARWAARKASKKA